MPQRFNGNKDLATFEKFNRELVGEPNIDDCGIIDQFVILYRVSTYDTETNMYGEAGGGKVYEAGVKLSCIIEAEDFDFNTDEFGPDTRQDAQFHFQRDMLIDVNFRPDIGDIVSWNLGYFEITKTNENQLVAGDYNKNWTISCTGTLTRINSLNIEQTRAF